MKKTNEINENKGYEASSKIIWYTIIIGVGVLLAYNVVIFLISLFN